MNTIKLRLFSAAALAGVFAIGLSLTTINLSKAGDPPPPCWHCGGSGHLPCPDCSDTVTQCDLCGGEGAGDFYSELGFCHDCNGQGRIWDRWIGWWVECASCDGLGGLPVIWGDCPECKGSGRKDGTSSVLDWCWTGWHRVGGTVDCYVCGGAGWLF